MTVKLKSKKNSRIQRKTNAKNTKSKRKRRFQRKGSMKRIGGGVLPSMPGKTPQSSHRDKFRLYLAILIIKCNQYLNEEKDPKKDPNKIDQPNMELIQLIHNCDNKSPPTPESSPESSEIVAEADPDCVKLEEMINNFKKEGPLKSFCIDFLTGRLEKLPDEIKRIPHVLRMKYMHSKVYKFERKITMSHLKKSTNEKELATWGGVGEDEDKYHIILVLLAELWKALLVPKMKNQQLLSKETLGLNKASSYLSKVSNTVDTRKLGDTPLSINTLGVISRPWATASDSEGLRSNVLKYIGSMWLNFHNEVITIEKLTKFNDLINYDETHYTIMEDADVSKIASEFIIPRNGISRG